MFTLKNQTTFLSLMFQSKGIKEAILAFIRNIKATAAGFLNLFSSECLMEDRIER